MWRAMQTRVSATALRAATPAGAASAAAAAAPAARIHHTARKGVHEPTRLACGALRSGATRCAVSLASGGLPVASPLLSSRLPLPLSSAVPAASLLHSHARLLKVKKSATDAAMQDAIHSAMAEGARAARAERAVRAVLEEEEWQRSGKAKERRRKIKRAIKRTLAIGGTFTLLYGAALMWNEEDRSWQLLMWKTLPLRFLSYLWGSVHRLTLPVFMRRPLYMAWTRAFNCHLDEMEGGPECLEDFPNLNSFFIRRIDLARVRPLDPAPMVSPVDGRVNVFGEVMPGGMVEQIKGMSYRVEDLLGHALPPIKPDSRMYYYVLYLAPGDYHRMHAPADCVIEERRHFPGALYPVAPSIARYIPSLFVRNERVCLSGHWNGGFFAMVPVGAYNVGSMKLTFDEALDTNLRTHTFTQYRPNLKPELLSTPYFKSYKKEIRPRLGAIPPATTAAPQSAQSQQEEVQKATDAFVRTDPAIDPHTFSNDPAAPGPAASASSPSGKQGAGGLSESEQAVPGAAAAQVGQPVMRVSDDGIHLPKGAEFSRFELGSTIVVVFQLDKGQKFNWNIEPEQKVKLGQRLGVILPAETTPQPLPLIK